MATKMAVHGHILKSHCRYLSLILVFARVSADSDPGVPFIEGQQDVCEGFICLHGGNCVNTTEKPFCNCLEGFSGKWCEIVISAPVKEGDCPAVPADASGQCPGYVCSTDVVCEGTQKCCLSDCATKVCVEPSPATAQTTLTSCVNINCLNGGVCQTINGAPVCFCLEGFAGERCALSTVDTPRASTRTIATCSKPGTCPPRPANSTGQCPGTQCSDDSTCPGAQKCCPTSCSTSVCSDSPPEHSTCDKVDCPVGSTCLVIRSSTGSSGQAKCILDADRTCWESGFAQAYLVPSPTETGKLDTIPCLRHFWFRNDCPKGSSCAWSMFGRVSICCTDQINMRRFRNTYWARRLHLKRREAGINPCGDCPDGQRCQRLDVECVNRPCPSQYRCVDVISSSLGNAQTKCRLPCPENYTCVIQAPRCDVSGPASPTGGSSSGGEGDSSNSRKSCDLTPIPSCVPEPQTDASMRSQLSDKEGQQ